MVSPTHAQLTDGHHTMAELYEHRHALFCALIAANILDTHNSSFKSWKHSDGEPCFGGGWFVAGLYLKHTGNLVTYHLPEHWWDVCPASLVELLREASHAISLLDDHGLLFEYDGLAGRIEAALEGNDA